MSTAELDAPRYTFVIDCAYRDSDGEHADHGEPCDYRWMCGTCYQVLGDTEQVCPAGHTPMEFPGLKLVDCDATPRHLLFVHTDDGYGGPCPQCQWDAAEERHRGCEHSHHGRWRSWKLTGRLAYWGARLGLWAGFRAYGNLCGGPRACHTRFQWGGRWSFLFVTTKQWIRWGHLPRHGHRWALSCHGCDGFGVCDRCSPCPLDDCPVSRMARS